jgi:hypothetical protein
LTQNGRKLPQQLRTTLRELRARSEHLADHNNPRRPSAIAHAMSAAFDL